MRDLHRWSVSLLAFLLLAQWEAAFTQCLALTSPLGAVPICSASASQAADHDPAPDDKAPAGKAHGVCVVCQILSNLTPPSPLSAWLPACPAQVAVLAAYFANVSPTLRANRVQARAPPVFSEQA